MPQTSLVDELREDAAPAVEDDLDDFTAERAASSLAGFQRGTFRARDEDADENDGEGENKDEDEQTPPSPAGTPAPHTDRS